MANEFEFIGFEPENELKTFSREVLWLVEDKSPSQAAKSASMTKLDTGFQTQFKITSSSGIFESEHISEDPKQSVEGAYLKIKSILKGWSANREQLDFE